MNRPRYLPQEDYGPMVDRVWVHRCLRTRTRLGAWLVAVGISPDWVIAADFVALIGILAAIMRRCSPW